MIIIAFWHSFPLLRFSSLSLSLSLMCVCLLQHFTNNFFACLDTKDSLPSCQDNHGAGKRRKVLKNELYLQYANELSYEKLMALDTKVVAVQAIEVEGLDDLRLHIVWIQWSAIV